MPPTAPIKPSNRSAPALIDLLDHNANVTEDRDEVAEGRHRQNVEQDVAYSEFVGGAGSGYYFIGHNEAAAPRGRRGRRGLPRLSTRRPVVAPALYGLAAPRTHRSRVLLVVRKKWPRPSFVAPSITWLERDRRCRGWSGATLQSWEGHAPVLGSDGCHPGSASQD